MPIPNLDSMVLGQSDSFNMFRWVMSGLRLDSQSAELEKVQCESDRGDFPLCPF